MLYMVIESYTSGPDPVYERAALSGRMIPDGLEYIDSWVDAKNKARCFQLMRTDEPRLFDVWIARWSDIVDFQIVEVVSSTDVSSSYLPDFPVVPPTR